MNILVIDDSRFLRGLISKTLARAGYAVTALADGEEGVLAARATRPSLILLDMMLPGLDGVPETASGAVMAGPSMFPGSTAGSVELH